MHIKEKELRWPRCIVASGCIWGSFGVAFVSAYALIGVAFGVLIHEICEWHKNGFKIKRAIERYYKLIISVTVPVLIAVAYFKFNHALKIAFDQFYRFNWEVYPKYYVMGENLAQPFINGVQYFFGNKRIWFSWNSSVVCGNIDCLFIYWADWRKTTKNQ